MNGKCVIALGMFLSIGAAANAYADLRVKSKYTSDGKTAETTIYTKGSRQRFETGAAMAIINQCDLQRSVQLIEERKSYMSTPTAGSSATVAAADAPSKGVVTFNINIADTGERKEMFGFTARRVKTITTKEAGPGTCNPGKETIETDGWYIDHEGDAAMCSANTRLIQASGQPGCADEIRYNQTGEGKLGYPLSYTLKTTKEDGTSTTMQMEVAEFSTASLDAALFEVPAGYSELKSFSDVGSALAASSQAGTAAQAAPAAKTPGTVRVGIPELGNRTAMTMSAASPRDQLIAELSKSKFDAVPLAGRSAAEFQEAARKLECDYVLEAEVIELKKGSGGLGKFGGLLNKASSLTGAGGAATKEKVEAKVEYKLMPLDGSKPLLSASAQGSNGGGFSVMNAVSLAANVGGFGLIMKLGMGAFNPNLMQTLGNMNGIAGAGGGLNLPGMPRGGLDAGVGPFMSIMQATQSAMNPAAPSEEGKALADALNETARNIAQALNKRK